MNTAQDIERATPVIRLLERTAMEQLRGVVEETLQKADDHLFDLGTDVALHALRILRRARQEIVEGYLAALRADVAPTLQGQLPAAPQDIGDHEGEGGVLSLMSEDALEDKLAREQLVRGLERHVTPQADIFHHRLQKLLSGEFGPDANPFGLARLAYDLNRALAGVDMTLDTRLTLYKFLERALQARLPSMYERLNTHLASAGIGSMPTAGVVRTIRPVGGVPSSAAAVPGFDQVEQGQAYADAYGGYPADVGPGTLDAAAFSGMLELLQAWRGTAPSGERLGSGFGYAPHAPRLATDDMLNVLSQLQRIDSPGLESALEDGKTSLALHLRNEVLDAAQRMGLGTAETQLSMTDADSLDLVGMMFDLLLDERQFEGDVRRKIAKLLVPYVRVAVRDRRLFLHKAHPARRLLNAVTEAYQGNHGDSPQERELLGKVDTVVDRLAAEYNEDMAIFSTLEQELRSYLEQHRKRSEIAERRAAEAQRGRERLEEARQTVARDLEILRTDEELPPVLAQFIERHLAHHLIQTRLRQGDHSAEYDNVLRGMTGIVATLEDARRHGQQPTLDPQERNVLQQILASSGCTDAAAEEVIDAIRTSMQPERDTGAGCDAPGVGAIPAALQVELPPVEAPLPPVGVIEEPASEPDIACNPDLVERINAMQVGTWLDMMQDGRLEPLKVSWISPISERLLLVNRRGIRVLVASATELAAMVERGELQLREGDSAFDHAFNRLTQRLQSDMAMSGATVPRRTLESPADGHS
ncbi:MAG: hypothetical protein DI635_03980 [Pseudoxanthomonas suwonensis]|nr:MAG: hypothetical protein DI635_03980 [Pseudoxanthomonas suwonensis]